MAAVESAWREDGVTPNLEDVAFTLALSSKCHCTELKLNTGNERRDHAYTWFISRSHSVSWKTDLSSQPALSAFGWKKTMPYRQLEGRQ